MRRQHGEISLWMVGVLMAAFAAISMAALFSMRYERNLFAEGLAWVLKSPAATATAGQVRAAADGASEAVGGGAAPAPGAMRKCVINGKTVVSNVDCAKEPSGKVIVIHDTRGIEAPKEPPAPAQPDPANLREQIIEKATR